MGKFPPGLRRRLCRLTCPPLAANSSSRAGARCGRGPALRCVHLRRIYSLLLCLAAKEFVHIRSAAPTALIVPGKNVAWRSSCSSVVPDKNVAWRSSCSSVVPDKNVAWRSSCSSVVPGYNVGSGISCCCVVRAAAWRGGVHAALCCAAALRVGCSPSMCCSAIIIPGRQHSRANLRNFPFVDDKRKIAKFAPGCYPVWEEVWRRGEAPSSKFPFPLSRRALRTTVTELAAMAAAPTMGESFQPSRG